MTICGETVTGLIDRLTGVPPSDGEILAAWNGAVAAFLDPASPERRAIQRDLVRTTRLSPEGLEAGLQAVLGGVSGEPAERLFAEAREMRKHRAAAGDEPAAPRDGFAVVFLASNLPALAVQPLVAALAARRPVLLKSPSAEPVFTPAFVRALVERLPALDHAVAAATWPGGSEELEAPLLSRAAVVVAYGDQPALDDLGRRTRRRGDARFVGFGPQTSLAVVGAGADLSRAAPGLARDVALFDQRGCLSVAAIYVEERKRGAQARSQELADPLAEELRDLARRWPMGPAGGPPDPADAGAVQQVRAEAELRGLVRLDLGLAEGTVIVEPEPAMQATPGLRTVRIHPFAPLGGLPEILAPWRGRLQGAALAGASAEALAPRLERLGVSRIAPPGELQTPDALWHNGGIHPLRVFTG
ncbi:MAG: acyl-CoA reductase [Acidobacteriota bacterium]|jgi:hypothetical protein